jgi:hypothetical protein
MSLEGSHRVLPMIQPRLLVTPMEHLDDDSAGSQWSERETSCARNGVTSRVASPSREWGCVEGCVRGPHIAPALAAHQADGRSAIADVDERHSHRIRCGNVDFAGCGSCVRRTHGALQMPREPSVADRPGQRWRSGSGITDLEFEYQLKLSGIASTSLARVIRRGRARYLGRGRVLRYPIRTAVPASNSASSSKTRIRSASSSR